VINASPLHAHLTSKTSKVKERKKKMEYVPLGSDDESVGGDGEDGGDDDDDDVQKDEAEDIPKAVKRGPPTKKRNLQQEETEDVPKTVKRGPPTTKRRKPDGKPQKKNVNIPPAYKGPSSKRPMVLMPTLVSLVSFAFQF
jgi:hypothetical protein